MPNTVHPQRLAGAALLCMTLLAGCAGSDRGGPAYYDIPPVSPLQVPPGLSTPQPGREGLPLPQAERRFLGSDEDLASVPPLRVQPAAPAPTLPEAYAPAARLEGDALLLDEDFARAWRRVGIALEALGLAVEDLNRSEGVYFIRTSAADGAAPPARRVQVRVVGDEQGSRVTVQPAGDEAFSSAEAQALLARIQEQLR